MPESSSSTADATEAQTRRALSTTPSKCPTTSFYRFFPDSHASSALCDPCQSASCGITSDEDFVTTEILICLVIGNGFWLLYSLLKVFVSWYHAGGHWCCTSKFESGDEFWFTRCLYAACH